MKRLLFLVLLLPAVAAEPDPVDAYRTCHPTVLGSIVQGCEDWFVYYPSRVDDPGNYRITVTVSTTTPATSNLAVDLASAQGVGCTVNLASASGTTTSATAQLSVTVTGKTCHVAAQLDLRVGTSTIATAAIGADIQQRITFLENVAEVSWFAWLLYVVATRFLRGAYGVHLRVLADVLALGFLALPIPPDQFRSLATAIYLVLVVDLFILIERPRGAP